MKRKSSLDNWIPFSAVCIVKDCGPSKWPLERGYCPKHYRRWWTHGDPNVILNRGHRQGTIKKGYKVILRDGRRTGEHVFIAEEKIGRLLISGEHVHHKNGKRIDNRPENLVVMSAADHRNLTAAERSLKNHFKRAYQALARIRVIRARYPGEW